MAHTYSIAFTFFSFNLNYHIVVLVVLFKGVSKFLYRFSDTISRTRLNVELNISLFP